MLIPLYDCAIVDVRTQKILATATLPLVPRVGEDLQVTAAEFAGQVFRVVSVQYEINDRQRVRTGHLSGVRIEVEPAV